MDVFSVVFQDFSAAGVLTWAERGRRAGNMTAREPRKRSGRLAASATGSKRCRSGRRRASSAILTRTASRSPAARRRRSPSPARLYKDAPFLILDEPTAALDPIAEAEIYEKLNDMVGDKTAIYISHRLSSCKFCDEIVVFDAGKIIQQGAHETLLADESGEYAQLWNAQAQYYR